MGLHVLVISFLSFRSVAERTFYTRECFKQIYQLLVRASSVCSVLKTQNFCDVQPVTFKGRLDLLTYI